jgi:hypothetical protein
MSSSWYRLATPSAISDVMYLERNDEKKKKKQDKTLISLSPNNISEIK